MGYSDKARRSDKNGFGNGTEMQIIIFPVKFDKFTMFFDKFPKSAFLVNYCNHTGYQLNLSVLH